MSDLKVPSYPGLVLYRCLLWLALPVVLLGLWWRSQRDPAYRSRWRECFGSYSAASKKGAIWFHTASAGETIAAAPTIRALVEAQDQLAPVLVTTMTPTGSEQVSALLGEAVEHCYAPYDFPFAVRRFLEHTQPSALILMETEIWPNLVLQAKALGIPVMLVNGRLSAKSARGYRRFRWLANRVLQAFDLIACQTSEHAQRFAQLGVAQSRLQVVGNVKYDLNIPADIEAQARNLALHLGPPPQRYWIAASTHLGEEEVVLRAHLATCQTVPNLTLLLAPRHPNRVAELASLLDRTVPDNWCRYSDLIGPRSEAISVAGSERPHRVVVVDQMGVLLPLFALAQVAFVGGSLIPRGGHNPIEPASVQTAVLTGPHHFNFAHVYAELVAAGACEKIDSGSLVTALQGLLGRPERCQAMSRVGGQVVAANKGATQRTIALIQAELSR
mgnify:CR=1 FL=1